MSSVYVGAENRTDKDESAELTSEEIFSTVMSPYCSGRLLRDCPSSAAAELKDRIRERVESGESKEDITQSLVSMFGDEIRAAPPFNGFGVLAWIIPFVMLLGGGALLYVWLKCRRKGELEWRAESNQSASGQTISESIRDEIQREIES